MKKNSNSVDWMTRLSVKKLFKSNDSTEDEEIFPTIKSSIQTHEMVNIETEESFFHSIGKEIKN
jgi:hypothetical protein